MNIKLKLRPFTIDDAVSVVQLVGDEAVSRWTSNIPFPYTEQDAIDWIEQTASDALRNPFAVELDGQLVACVSFWPYDSIGIEVGYWVGREYWKKGIGTAALQKLLNSKYLPVKSDVFAKVMAENIGSQRVLEKCGFSFLKNDIIIKNNREADAKLYVRRAVI